MTIQDKAPVPSLRNEPAPNAKRSAVKVVYFRENGTALCSARKSYCNRCGHEYEDPEQPMNCPSCGHLRICMHTVAEAGLRCKSHGGRVPVGPANPSWKGGRHSAMPARLRERYIESMDDDELLSIRRDLALIEARIGDVLERVDFGEAGKHWSRAQNTFVAFKDAVDRGDSETMRIHLNTLERVLAKGTSDYAAWEGIIGLIEQRRKLTETEMRRLEKMQQFVTAEQVSNLMVSIAEASKRIIQDPKILNEFTAELASLLR